jgi:uncharacterized protein
MILIKTYKQGEDLLLSACDEDLIGKKFEEGKFYLDVSEKFYKGQKIKIDELINHLKKATIANLVGSKTIKFAIKHGFVDPDCVLKVQGVPHAQVVTMI